ncbi:unannotated protein [freshwater metagenome]|uniref:Unannotated protein n=1 Tax=freshwater metagenome TaxID=449393 RepID=A0A6J7UXG7_9ZZZZ
MPWNAVIAPPINNFPSVWSARAFTVPFGPVPRPLLKLVSSVPSLFRRATFATEVPLKVVNCPPTKIFPSACITMVFTPASKPVPTAVLNEESGVPSLPSRAIPTRLEPFSVVKVPPTTILPSDCTASALTNPPAKPVPTFVLNEVSGVPSLPSRAIFLALFALSVVKTPPTTILPSDCRATALTVWSKPDPMLVAKVLSGTPAEDTRATRLCVTALRAVKMPPTTILPST